MKANHEIWRHCPVHGWWDARSEGLVCPDCKTQLMKNKKPKAAKQAMYNHNDLRCPITGYRLPKLTHQSSTPLAVQITKLPKSRRG